MNRVDVGQQCGRDVSRGRDLAREAVGLPWRNRVVLVPQIRVVRLEAAVYLRAGNAQRDHEGIVEIAAQSGAVEECRAGRVITAEQDVDVDRRVELLGQTRDGGLGAGLCCAIQWPGAIPDVGSAQEPVHASQRRHDPALERERSRRRVDGARLVLAELGLQLGAELEVPVVGGRAVEQDAVDLPIRGQRARIRHVSVLGNRVDHDPSAATGLYVRGQRLGRLRGVRGQDVPVVVDVAARNEGRHRRVVGRYGPGPGQPDGHEADQAQSESRQKWPPDGAFPPSGLRRNQFRP